MSTRLATVIRRDWRAMSCDVRLVVHGGDASLGDLARRRLDELERRWSRFRPDSEIARLNAATGTCLSCSADTVRLVRELVGAWWLTDGAFDPTLLRPLVELGYAASRSDQTLRTSLTEAAASRGRPDRILVDDRRRTVQLPSGTVLDPGGLGKGLAADLVVADLLVAGAAGALVSVGGDVRVGGHAPDGAAWTIAVAPTPADTPLEVALRSGAVATSTSRLRTWTVAGETRHHLLDPATGAPTDGDVVAATVIAGTGALAEAFSKVPFVRGPAEALALAGRHRLAVRITTDDGAHVHSDAWGDFAR